MTIDTAIILAGGLGTRLRSLVADVPKPMAPVGSKPFLSYLMNYWYSQGIRHFILSVGYMHQVIIDYYGSCFLDAKISYAVEQVPLGTGGGLLLASQQYKSNHSVLVLNGDTYFKVSLKALENFASQNQAEVLLSAFESNNTQRYMPLDVGLDGQLNFAINRNIKTRSSPIWVNGGVYLIKPSLLQTLNFNQSEKFSLERDVFNKLYEKNIPIYAKLFHESFIDIGVPDDYLQFQQSQFKETI